MNNRQISTQEECIFAIGRGYGERKRAAARTVKQVYSTIADASGGCNVFDSGGQRKPTLEVVGGQERSSFGAGALGDADLRVGRHIGVLEVGLNHPISFAVGIEQVVDLGIIQGKRCGEGALRVRSGVSAGNKCESISRIERIRY